MLLFEAKSAPQSITFKKLLISSLLNMYYRSDVEGVVRVSPTLFKEELGKAILEQLKKDYEEKVDEILGRVIKILDVKKIEEGVLIPGDGAAYYRTLFTAIHYVPEIQELVEGEVKDIAKFGAFIDFGPFEGMVHISQAMDDFVSVSKVGSLQGKSSKKILKVGDRVRARIIAVSLRDLGDPKIGLTMRQPYLGKIEWLEDERKDEEKAARASSKSEKPAAKSGKGKKGEEE